MTRGARRLVVVLAVLAVGGAAHAQPADEGDAFAFAVFGSTHAQAERDGAVPLRAMPADRVRFVVHFDSSVPSPASCGADALEARRRLLDASPLPIVPVVAAAAWSSCGGGEVADAANRLARLGDALFAGEESAGRSRLRLARQSGLPRFGRYRENVRWQSGRVLFVTFNLPDNNNNYRAGAGGNGEFDDRSLANHGWLERAFRYANERRLEGIVLFVDAAPRFERPLRVPDPASRERDGYYEWKNALRTLVASYRGQVLLVQGHSPNPNAISADEHPLRDAGGQPLPNLTRIVVPDPIGGDRWLRIDVEPRAARLFRVTRERIFDDPSGELYGGSRGR